MHELPHGIPFLQFFAYAEDDNPANRNMPMVILTNEDQPINHPSFKIFLPWYHTQIKAIKANKPVGGKTTCGAVRRLQQGLCQTVKFIRMTMYPKERGRTAGRAYISFVGTNTTINLFIPCNVISTCGMWEHRQKMRFTVRLWESMPGSGFAFTLCYRGVRLELPPSNSYTLTSIVTIRDN